MSCLRKQASILLWTVDCSPRRSALAKQGELMNFPLATPTRITDNALGTEHGRVCCAYHFTFRVRIYEHVDPGLYRQKAVMNNHKEVSKLSFFEKS